MASLSRDLRHAGFLADFVARQTGRGGTPAKVIIMAIARKLLTVVQRNPAAAASPSSNTIAQAID